MAISHPWRHESGHLEGEIRRAPQTHHGVGPQHLQAYLNEFTFRFNRRFYPFNAFRSLLGIATGVPPQTYADLYAAKARNTTSSGVGVTTR